MPLRNRSGVGTLVERSSSSVILLHLADGKSAEDVRDAVIAALAPFPPQLRTSLTCDQGTEMALHADITTLGMPQVQFRPGLAHETLRFLSCRCATRLHLRSLWCPSWSTRTSVLPSTG